MNNPDNPEWLKETLNKVQRAARSKLTIFLPPYFGVALMRSEDVLRRLVLGHDRLDLWLHLVSKHFGGVYSPWLSARSMEEMHISDHLDGGSNLGHKPDDLSYDLPRVGEVLDLVLNNQGRRR